MTTPLTLTARFRHDQTLAMSGHVRWLMNCCNFIVNPLAKAASSRLSNQGVRAERFAQFNATKHKATST
jgi:hypothetical protein